ncbi:MAG: hypothetical protein AAF611_09645 [Bacteroidota bacterium]
MGLLDRLKKTFWYQILFIASVCIGGTYGVLQYFHGKEIKLKEEIIRIKDAEFQLQGTEYTVKLTSKDLYINQLKDSILIFKNRVNPPIRSTNNSNSLTSGTNKISITNEQVSRESNVSENDNKSFSFELYDTQSCNDVIKLFYSYGKKVTGVVLLESEDRENMVKIWNKLQSSCGEAYLKNSLGDSYRQYQLIMESWSKK